MGAVKRSCTDGTGGKPGSDLDGGSSTASKLGRPLQLTPGLVTEIGQLRAAALSWKEIGLRLGRNPETCRRALWAVKKARRAVGNSPTAIPEEVLADHGNRSRYTSAAAYQAEFESTHDSPEL